jgi:hypothetical protein
MIKFLVYQNKNTGEILAGPADIATLIFVTMNFFGLDYMKESKPDRKNTIFE